MFMLIENIIDPLNTRHKKKKRNLIDNQKSLMRKIIKTSNIQNLIQKMIFKQTQSKTEAQFNIHKIFVTILSLDKLSGSVIISSQLQKVKKLKWLIFKDYRMHILLLQHCLEIIKKQIQFLLLTRRTVLKWTKSILRTFVKGDRL